MTAINAVKGVEVENKGEQDDPFLIDIKTATASEEENKHYRIYSSNDAIARAEVARATVTRVSADLVDALLGGKPDLEAMFERPANETQLFDIVGRKIDNGQVVNTVTGDFTLSYNGDTTDTLSETSTIGQIETALESLTGLSNVTVKGAGTLRDPFIIKIVTGVADPRGDFYSITSSNVQIASQPMDIADAAATVRPSVSLSEPMDYQRVFYDKTLENVTIRGGKGTIVLSRDDSMAAMKVLATPAMTTSSSAAFLRRSVRLMTTTRTSSWMMESRPTLIILHVCGLT